MSRHIFVVDVEKWKLLTRLSDVKAKAYFLSDIHLESEKDSNFFVFNRLLKKIIEDKSSTHLFLLGDIFDLWVADHKHFKQKFEHSLKTLDRVKDRGIEVHYFEGNHDLDLKPYFSERGFFTYENPMHVELGEKTFRLEHGDQMDPEDRGYLFLRWFLRTWFMRRLGRSLPGFVVERIGNSMSSTSRKYTDQKKSNLGKDDEVRRQKILDKIRRHVLHLLNKNLVFDLFVAGHIHEEMNEEVAFKDKKVQVVNLGSWLGERKPYGVFDGDKIIISDAGRKS